MYNSSVRFITLVLVLLGILAPASLHAFEPLPRMTPSSVGIDPVALDQALVAFSQVEGAWSIVVVRQGAVVAERYLVTSPETLHPVWSVTKSLTSIAVGMTIEDGVFSGVEVRLVDHLPADLVPQEPAKAQIKMQNLLMMTSGLQWSEDLDWLMWLASLNPAEFILQRPLEFFPGNMFVYSSASSHLPSLMMTTAMAENLDAYMGREFFGPLGITDWLWDKDPQGYAYGGHGVHLRTEDLAKLGILFLNNGVWSGQEVVSPEWVGESTAPRFLWGDSWGPLDKLNYGYLWWVAETAGYPMYLAWGWGGQFVFCVPDLDLVVATAADGEVYSAQAEAQELGILRAIVNDLLPGVRPSAVFLDSFESGSISAWTQ